MTHEDDARVADLVARLGDADATDLFRRLVQRGMQDLIDSELSAAIGAEPHERTDTRTNQRNGARTRTLSTPAGDVQLKIPKPRVGSFYPSLLEPRRRDDKALWAVIMFAYITGTSTRKVDDLVRALGCVSGVSKSTVSRICAGIDEEIAAFRTRPLGHVAMPYVYLDAIYIKARVTHRIVSRAVVVPTAVTADGNREVLGLDVGDSEDEVFWTTFLRSLRDRGLGGGRLVSLLRPRKWSQQPSGPSLLKPARQRPPHNSVRWSRCSRASFPMPPKPSLQLRSDVCAYATFPRAHWRKIVSTNPLERINKEIKRRSNVVGSSPTTTRSSASSALCSSTSTTNGKPPTAGTSPKHQWHKSTTQPGGNHQHHTERAHRRTTSRQAPRITPSLPPLDGTRSCRSFGAG